MQGLAIFLIFSVTVLPYLADGDRFGRARILPGAVGYAPELLSVLALLFVVVQGARHRFTYVRPAYWIAFGAIVVLMICGVVANGVGPGPIFAGLRLYLRAIPWFLVPALFAFSEANVRRQLRFLLAICLLQVPLAIEQRIHTGQATYGFVAVTGDWTTGTLGESGVLSIFLICAACIIAAMYERGVLKPWQFLLLLVALLLPTTINETKATLVLLPLGLLVSIIFAAKPGRRLGKMLLGVGLVVAFIAIFVPVYDSLNKDREYSTKIGDFFSDKAKVEEYLGMGSAAPSSGPSRAGAVVYPLQRLSEDPVTLAFGYGIGNASGSRLGGEFTGAHAKEFDPYIQSTFARFVLELGVLGMLVLGLLYVLILQDCFWLARRVSGMMGALAAGWVGVVAIIFLSMFYTLLEAFPAIGFLFWYGSGLIAAQRMRLTVTARDAAGGLSAVAAPA